MALTDDLVRIAAAAAPHGSVSAVLAAEPADGVRRYLVALGEEDAPHWLVLDDAGAPVARRNEVRDAASIVAICELAVDAAAAVGVAVGEPPHVASPGFLDEIGAAADGHSEFTGALREVRAANDEGDRVRSSALRSASLSQRDAWKVDSHSEAIPDPLRGLR
jgi:hypothetical protein